MKLRRRRDRLPTLLAALGQPEMSRPVGELIAALGARPAEVWERTIGAPARRVRRVSFDSGGEIILSNDAVVAVLLHLQPTRGLRLADWIAGTRDDASLDDLKKALRRPAHVARSATPYFAVDGGYLRPTFQGGHPWRNRGGLLSITVTATAPGSASVPTDDDCTTCSDLLVRSDDGSGGVEIDATIRQLSSALAADLLTEDADRVSLADLRPLHDSGLMDRVESQLTCTTCNQIICFTLFRDSDPTFDYYAWNEARWRPREPIPPVEQWGDPARIAQADDEMHYIDHAPGGWFLVQRHADLYLDARYSYSGAIDDSALIHLDEAECVAYRARGRDYLSELATGIHTDGPYRKESPYYARDLYRGPDGATYRRDVGAAIADHTWLAEQRRAATGRQD